MTARPWAVVDLHPQGLPRLSWPWPWATCCSSSIGPAVIWLRAETSTPRSLLSTLHTSSSLTLSVCNDGTYKCYCDWPVPSPFLHHPSSLHPTLQAHWTRTTTHIRSHLQRASGRWAPPHRISADCLLKAGPGRLLSLAQPILLNCPMKVITAPVADVGSGQTLLYCKHQDSTQQKSSLHWVCPWCNGECKTKGR